MARNQEVEAHDITPEALEGEVVSREPETLPALAEPTAEIPPIALTERRLEELKKAVTLYADYKKAALGLTTESDWVNQNGSPYLEASGCEAIAVAFGIEWWDVKLKRHDRVPDEGEPWYFYTCEGKMRSRLLGGLTREFIGKRASRDKFFTVRWDKKGDGPAKRIELPVEEVVEQDVMMSAMTNFIRNGVTRLLGLRSVTWEDIADAGIDISSLTKIERKAKPKKQEKEKKAPAKKAAKKEETKEEKGAEEPAASEPSSEDEGWLDEEGRIVVTDPVRIFKQFWMADELPLCPNGHELYVAEVKSGQNQGKPYARCPEGCTTDKDRRDNSYNFWGWVAQEE